MLSARLPLRLERSAAILTWTVNPDMVSGEPFPAVKSGPVDDLWLSLRVAAPRVLMPLSVCFRGRSRYSGTTEHMASK